MILKYQKIFYLKLSSHISIYTQPTRFKSFKKKEVNYKVYNSQGEKGKTMQMLTLSFPTIKQLKKREREEITKPVVGL